MKSSQISILVIFLAIVVVLLNFTYYHNLLSVQKEIIAEHKETIRRYEHTFEQMDELVFNLIDQINKTNQQFLELNDDEYLLLNQNMKTLY
ncbi:MAG: hypothetical protein FWG98_06845 [Candidatus Cloacimonetes bacterium]|nr:hypothetical protein [Candidatus Cloacimonadota bacterium]